jgi:predicted membrane protein DUF2243
MSHALVAVTADTTTERVLAVLLGAGILLLMLALVWRRFPRTFVHGFVVAAGVFLSVDIVVFHWILRLHRITAGPEADVIEPVLVALGAGFLTYGLLGERARAPRAPHSNGPPATQRQAVRDNKRHPSPTTKHRPRRWRGRQSPRRKPCES